MVEEERCDSPCKFYFSCPTSSRARIGDFRKRIEGIYDERTRWWADYSERIKREYANLVKPKDVVGIGERK